MFIAIFEPFVNMRKIDGYRRFLGFTHCLANSNGKIWCFWKHIDHEAILINDEQQITLHFKDNLNIDNYVTVVYAKYTFMERRDLWDSIESMSNRINGLWYIGGDFNSIMDPNKKLGVDHIELTCVLISLV